MAAIKPINEDALSYRFPLWMEDAFYYKDSVVSYRNYKPDGTWDTYIYIAIDDVEPLQATPNNLSKWRRIFSDLTVSQYVRKQIYENITNYYKSANSYLTVLEKEIFTPNNGDTNFQITETPVGEVLVYVNGILNNNFSYDSDNTEVVYNGLNTLSSLDELTIVYNTPKETNIKLFTVDSENFDVTVNEDSDITEQEVRDIVDSSLIPVLQEIDNLKNTQTGYTQNLINYIDALDSDITENRKLIELNDSEDSLFHDSNWNFGNY
jgi:hypothetical protein